MGIGVGVSVNWELTQKLTPTLKSPIVQTDPIRFTEQRTIEAKGLVSCSFHQEKKLC